MLKGKEQINDKDYSLIWDINNCVFLQHVQCFDFNYFYPLSVYSQSPFSLDTV